MSTRRRFLSLALALLLTLIPWAATAAPASPPPESLSITKVFDWLADLDPLGLLTSLSSISPHLDPDGTPVVMPADDPQSTTQQPPDGGTEAGPHLDPNG